METTKRFEHLYNEIDHHIREKVNASKEKSFMACLKEYNQRYNLGRSYMTLRAINELRNLLTHQAVSHVPKLAVPSEELMRDMEKIHLQITKPELVVPRFQKPVISLVMTDTLLTALERISENDISQFPVEKDGKIEGLLTENGITRWLAHHATKKFPLVDLGDVQVKEVLWEEEPRQNYRFIAKNVMMLDAQYQFREQVQLEALLITQNGKAGEGLMGIVTRSDVIITAV